MAGLQGQLVAVGVDHSLRRGRRRAQNAHSREDDARGSHSTSILIFMPEWIEHSTSTGPGFDRVTLFESPLRNTPRSNGFDGETEMTLCGTGSSFVKRTVSPALTFSAFCEKAMYFCTTVCSAASTAAATPAIANPAQNPFTHTPLAGNSTHSALLLFYLPIRN